MKGLPDDMCQCPHWGYVLAGKVTFRFADRDETTKRAMRSTRRPATFPSSTSPGGDLMFSPADELAKTEAVMMAEHAGAAAGLGGDDVAGNSSSGRSPCCIAKNAAAARDCASIFA